MYMRVEPPTDEIVVLHGASVRVRCGGGGGGGIKAKKVINSDYAASTFSVFLFSFLQPLGLLFISQSNNRMASSLPPSRGSTSIPSLHPLSTVQ